MNGEDFHYIDDYGDPIPQRDNGTMFIPEDVWPEFYALSLVESTGISYDRLCDMPYDEYYKLASLARAKSWTPATRPKHEKYL